MTLAPPAPSTAACAVLLLASCVHAALLADDIMIPNCSRGGYVYHKEAKGWLKLHRVSASWNDARRICHYEGAVLASPLTEGVRIAMVTELQSLQRAAFTGIRAFDDFGYFYSIEGVNLEDMGIDWAPQEPDNRENNERCITLKPSGLVADVPCEVQYPYICFRDVRAGINVNEECGTPDKSYSKDNVTGNCYKFHSECMAWRHAHTVCSAEGGSLVVLNSDYEAQLIKRLLDKNLIKSGVCDHDRFVFIGVYNWAKKNLPTYWATLDGTTLKEAGFDSWGEHEPNNAKDNEYCGAIVRGNTPTLNDVTCDTRIPFICELKPCKS